MEGVNTLRNKIIDNSLLNHLIIEGVLITHFISGGAICLCACRCFCNPIGFLDCTAIDE